MAMTIIKKAAKALLALTIFTCSLGVSAAPDNLLEQMRARFAQKGSAGVAELAKGYGLSTRVENNQLLVPVVIDRSVGETAHFASRLSQATARVDANSRSYTRLMVPASRLDTLIKLFPNEYLRAPIPAFPDIGHGSIVSESVALTAADGYQVGNLDEGSRWQWLTLVSPDWPMPSLSASCQPTRFLWTLLEAASSPELNTVWA